MKVMSAFRAREMWVRATAAALLLLGAVPRAVQAEWAQATSLDASVSTVTTNGVTWRVLQFTNTGTNQLEITQAGNLEYLIVAGGGAGGRGRGGAGGAGGMLTGTTNLLADTFNVVVGAGGLGDHNTSPNLGQGYDSSLGTIVASGGGRGGRYASAGANIGLAATIGGSGGGGGGVDPGVPRLGAAGIAGQGNAGGTSSGGTHGAGGGGRGADGATSGGGSAGGIGQQSDITGELTYYAGGGGGFRGSGDQAAGGLGGGGTGASTLYSTTLIATDGDANTGGGGGGGNNVTGIYGGNGGSGIVAVRYRVLQGTLIVIR